MATQNSPDRMDQKCFGLNSEFGKGFQWTVFGMLVDCETLSLFLLVTVYSLC
jgi:hypothetical protein